MKMRIIDAKVEIIIPDSSYQGIMAINKEEFTFAGTTTEGEGESGDASYSNIIFRCCT